MPSPSRKSKEAVQGSALLISLMMIVLISVVVLVFTAQTQLERQLSSTQFSDQKSQAFTQIGFDTALTLIRETLRPFDDPFGSTARPTNFWSLSPGRVDYFALATSPSNQPTRTRTIALHSGYPVTNPNDAADLNAPDGFGRRPIRSGTNNLTMEVEWVAVAQNPSAALSSSNSMVGRFAFWVDDEGSKINVNTADGSDNYTLSSYGQGTPTAVSLSVFRDLGDTNAPNRAAVRRIAAEGRRQPFAMVSDMAKRSALTNVVHPNFPATYEDNLTTFSRSPDFNIFNLPKIQLVPNNITSVAQMTNSGAQPWNVFTSMDRRVHYFNAADYYNVDPSYNSRWWAASHLRSVYPTQSQLTGNHAAAWPVMAAEARPATGFGISQYNLLAHSGNAPAGANIPFNQLGRMDVAIRTEYYLLGYDSLWQPIIWPFINPNYTSKYNRRQLDSITLQTLELARGAGDGAGDGGDNQSGISHTATIAPFGITGGKPVMTASGRYPRLSRAIAKVELSERVPAYPKVGPTNYHPDIQVYTTSNSTNRPAWKQLGDPLIDDPGLYDGAELRIHFALSLYIPRYLYESDNFVGQVSLNPSRSLPANMVGDGHALVDSTTIVWTNQEPFGWHQGGKGPPGHLNETDWSNMVNERTGSAWMDYLVQAEASYDNVTFLSNNSSGIDFRGLAPSRGTDPDPIAPQMRRREYKSVSWGNPATNLTGPALAVWASGPDPNSDRGVWEFSTGGNFSSSPVAGLFSNYGLNSAGFIRRTRNEPPPDATSRTSIKKLLLKGGVTFRLNHHGHAGMVAPVDQIIGPLFPNNWSTATTNLTDPASLARWRKQAKLAVIPVFLGTNQPDGKFSTNGVELAVGQTRFIVSKPRDPLLGQLPGDWVSQIYPSMADLPTNSAIRRVFTSWPDVRVGAEGFNGNLNRNIGNYDFLPEPEWVDMAADAGSMNVVVGAPAAAGQHELLLPYEENGIQKIDIVRGTAGAWRSRYLNISKQRSFPSVGHLQYLRTGAMPDRDAATLGDPDYAGMPFRCLNFGPANTQAGIPDWAMLDLFTVPNSIWTLPSSRFAYPTLTTWEGATRPELIQLTYGGASSGKINLNGSVLWPWAGDADVNKAANYIRPLPLAAQFNGLRYNRDGRVIREEFAIPNNIGGKATPGPVSWMGNVGANINRMAVLTSTNSWRVLQPTEAERLSTTIAEYIRVNGPLSMPGQMCNILPGMNGIGVTSFGAQIPTTSTPTLRLLPPDQNGNLRSPGSDHFYATNVHSGGINRTRNDIVSQSIGNLVTQGNVFAIWVVGQSIQKSSTSDPTRFEPDKGDKIAGQTRLRFLVERKLDPGVDGVYGNSKTSTSTSGFVVGPSGWDITVGTPDDLMDPDYHPPNPKFIYEVVNVREVQ